MKAFASLASVLALVLAVSSAQAATETTTSSDTTVTYERDSDHPVLDSVKGGLDKADAKLREGADSIRAFFVGDNDAAEQITIPRHRTADGMLGKDVMSPAGKDIADVKDILIDSQGKATTIIISDGGLLGIGDKLAAFDFSKVVTQNDDGVVMALTQEMIDGASDFSYNPKDMKTAKVIPPNSVSVKDILDGDLLDVKGKDVGDIENVEFNNGQSSRLIVSYNKKLGLGGDYASFDYGSLEMVKKDKAVNFKLNEAQSNRFKHLTKSAKK